MEKGRGKENMSGQEGRIGIRTEMDRDGEQ